MSSRPHWANPMVHQSFSWSSISKSSSMSLSARSPFSLRRGRNTQVQLHSVYIDQILPEHKSCHCESRISFCHREGRQVLLIWCFVRDLYSLWTTANRNYVSPSTHPNSSSSQSRRSCCSMTPEAWSCCAWTKEPILLGNQCDLRNWYENLQKLKVQCSGLAVKKQKRLTDK